MLEVFSVVQTNKEDVAKSVHGHAYSDLRDHFLWGASQAMGRL